MIIRIVPVSRHAIRPGVLADWEIVFTEGPLTGLKLVGGSILQSLYKYGQPYVDLPRDGEFELLRLEYPTSMKRLDQFKSFVLTTWQEATDGATKRGGRLSYHVQVVNLDSPLED